MRGEAGQRPKLVFHEKMKNKRLPPIVKAPSVDKYTVPKYWLYSLLNCKQTHNKEFPWYIFPSTLHTLSICIFSGAFYFILFHEDAFRYPEWNFGGMLSLHILHLPIYPTSPVTLEPFAYTSSVKEPQHTGACYYLIDLLMKSVPEFSICDRKRKRSCFRSSVHHGMCLMNKLISKMWQFGPSSTYSAIPRNPSRRSCPFELNPLHLTWVLVIYFSVVSMEPQDSIYLHLPPEKYHLKFLSPSGTKEVVTLHLPGFQLKCPFTMPCCLIRRS